MAGIETTAVAKMPGSLDEMTVGAPRSAREALQSGAITPRSAAGRAPAPGWAQRPGRDRRARLLRGPARHRGPLSPLVGVRARRAAGHSQLQLRRPARARERPRHTVQQSAPQPVLRQRVRVSPGLHALRSPAGAHGSPPLPEHRPRPGSDLQPAERAGARDPPGPRPGPLLRLRAEALPPVLPVATGRPTRCRPGGP